MVVARNSELEISDSVVVPIAVGGRVVSEEEQDDLHKYFKLL